MCKIKEYSETMHRYLNSVLLRLDTYFLREDLSEHAKLLKDLTNGIPSEIPFDEINGQLIDIDSVAILHDTYLNTILESKTMVCITHGNLNGTECDIFLNKYFIAFYIPIEAKRQTIEDSINAIREVYMNRHNIPLLFSYLRLNYSVERCGKKDLWEICDRSAFPVMEGNVYNGQYTDSIERNGMYIDLSRTISPSDAKSALYDVNIQTKTLFPVSDIKGATEKIPSAVKESKDEISRCFRI